MPLAPPRRDDVAAAFAHLERLAEEADVAGIVDPLAAWVARVRHFMRDYGGVGVAPALEGVRFTDVSADGVPAQWVQAAGSTHDRRIVYLHGGAWCAGDIAGYRGIAALLAIRTGASVLLADYRLSPEHRFPAGLEDCARALAWAAEHGPGAGRLRPATFLALGGDSAGGNLSAATCLLTIRRGGRVPDRLVLIAGSLDNVPCDERVGRDDPIANAEGFTNQNAAYLRPGDRLDDPLISPVYADEGELAKFPPTLLQVSGTESLLYDSLQFAQRLRSADVRCLLSVWPGLPHVWHQFLGLLPEASEALDEIAHFLNDKVTPPAG